MFFWLVSFLWPLSLLAYEPNTFYSISFHFQQTSLNHHWHKISFMHLRCIIRYFNVNMPLWNSQKIKILNISIILRSFLFPLCNLLNPFFPPHQPLNWFLSQRLPSILHYFRSVESECDLCVQDFVWKYAISLGKKQNKQRC